MNTLDINFNRLNDECMKLYKKIKNTYDYDLVVFIAKGSYLIGKEIAELNNVPLIEIRAERKGNKLKTLLKPVLKIIPKRILNVLREKEMKSVVHVKHVDRNVSYDEKKYSNFKDKKRILLIDDSADSGNSLILCVDSLKKYFTNSEIKTCTLNVMNHSEFIPDYYLYKNTIIRGPWSSDSVENRKFLNEYYDWHREEYK